MNENIKGTKKINLKKVLILILFVIIIVTISLLFAGKSLNNEETVQTASKEVVIEDNEAPTLTLNGDREKIIVVGNKYSEQGATAVDNIDGNISNKIEIINNVDTSKKGTYEVKYKVEDEAGNISQDTRKVIVCNKLSSKGLPVLMYHFFYDKNKGKGNDNNWIEISNFESQIKYLSDNNYYFPTWKEVEKYIDGKYELPEKSIVITVDDGDASFFDLAVPILNKYDIDATSFVITGWYGYRAKEPRQNVIYQSHTYNMHESGANGKGRMLNWRYNDVLNDLKKSSEILGGADIFCYPFGQYNESNIKAVKEAGYKLAVTTMEGRVRKGTKKYELPRVRISRNTRMEYFKELVE